MQPARLYEAGGFHASGQLSAERYDTAIDSLTAVANMNNGLYNLCAVTTYGSTVEEEEQDSFDPLIAKASDGRI
jgi:hypothetical protein